MKRLMILLALTGLAAACGDDDGDDKSDDKVGDAGSDAAKIDGSTSVKVSNPGAACSSAAQCMGDAPTCDTKAVDGTTYTGGYCSASCLSAAECGPTGACPVGELVSILGPNSDQLPGITAGQCWQKCEALNQRSTCREGYVCTNLATVRGIPASVPSLSTLVCLPYAGAAGDAGAGDASVTDASGIDAAAL